MPSFTKLISSITGSSNSAKTLPSPLLPTSTYDKKKSNTNKNILSHHSNNSTDEYHTSVCNKPNPKQPILVTVAVESPPITLYGNPSESSGAFFSGTFILDIFLDKNAATSSSPLNELTPITSPSNTLANTLSDNSTLQPMMSVSQLTPSQLHQNYIILKNVSLYLIQTVSYGKPFTLDSTTLQNCNKCNKKITELARWDILSKKTAFAKGSSHSCPFSHIIPGSVPPTTILSTPATSIKYELICKVTYVDPKSGKDHLINLAQPINIQRSILREQDRNSTRIFPPTDVSSTAVIPNVAYPRSTFPVEIRLDHVSTPRRRWRMRKLNWRLEEMISVKAHHCDQHAEKYSALYQTMKKQKKSAKLSKTSGGVGRANINYHFQTPTHQLNNTNSSISNRRRVRGDNNNNETNNNDTESNAAESSELNPSTSTTSQTPQLAPAASNWSVSASPVNSNPMSNIASNSLDQILSMTTSSANPNQQLANPDEVIVPISKPTEEIFIEEIRTISSGELKSGWKSDFSGLGRIELVVEISLMNLISMGLHSTFSNKGSINSQTCNARFNELYDDNNNNSECNCSIDVDDPDLGIYVTHNLILEVVVAEEMMQGSLASPNQIAKARQHQSNSNAVGSSISSNSTAAIVTGNVHSQSRMRPPLQQTSDSTRSTVASTSMTNNHTNNNSSTTASRTTLSEDDFPDDRVGPQPLDGNKTDVINHTQGVPTGVARVLRMQFKVILSERSGLGVAWDDEVPPTYHAVSALSPPTYEQSATESVSSPNYHDLVVPLDDENEVPLEMSNLRI